MGRRRKEQASLDTLEAVEAPVLAAEEIEALNEVAAQEEAPAIEEETPPITNPTQWVVLEEKVVSLFGQMTTLSVGTVVSARSYGPEGVKRILQQDVMMEPIG